MGTIGEVVFWAVVVAMCLGMGWFTWAGDDARRRRLFRRRRDGGGASKPR